MRIINIDLSQDARCPQKVFGGNAREHNESKLVVKLPERMLRDDISYYYFEFQTVLGEHIVSPNIYKNELSGGNKISVALWEQLLPFAGDLNFCVNAVNLAEDNTITIKGKTSICVLQILKSPTGDDALIDVNSTKDELQEVIDKALQEAKDSGDFKGDPGDVNTLQMNTACANALRGSAFGSAVQMDDVSPNEHTLGVKVSSKNLLNPSVYYRGRVTFKGVTYTVNSDTITMTGTATASLYLSVLSSNADAKLDLPEQLRNKKIRLFAYGNTSDVEAVFYTEAGTYFGGISTTSISAFDTTGASKWGLRLRFTNGQTYNDTIKIMICEEGAEDSPSYTPYISDLTSVNVTRYGKNLFDKNNASIIVGYLNAGNVIEPASTTKSVYISCMPNTIYTVSKVVTARFAVAFTDALPASGVAVTGKVQNNTATSITATSGTNSKYIVVWLYHANYDTTITIDEILATLQIELGTTTSSYEPYQGQSYTPAVDGTVSNVKSLYPTTTLMTDTEGTIIEVEYNKDINKAFAELQQAILSMGGNT